jgi:hypothetical protein
MVSLAGCAVDVHLAMCEIVPIVEEKQKSVKKGNGIVRVLFS